ncbi:MAG: Zn-dependent hydrolase, partial [Sphaerospermopsis kisseleviana]
DFLNLMTGVNVRRSNGDTVNIASGNLKENTEIQVLSYKF